jgi:adenylosuccinate lyase
MIAQALAAARPDLAAGLMLCCTRADLARHGAAIAAAMAREPGLGNPARARHATRDDLAHFAGLLSLVTGTLGKMGQDICLMAQQGLDEIALFGHAAQAEPGSGRTSGDARTLQRRAAWRDASRAGS